MNFTTTHIRSEKVTIDMKSISLPLPRIWS